MASEVDDCIKRLMSYKGVTGVVVVNIDGVPIKSTLENASAIQYTAQILQMVDKARSWVKEIDNTNDLTFLRLRTTKHEVVIVPEGDYTIFVIQEPFTYQYL